MRRGDVHEERARADDRCAACGGRPLVLVTFEKFTGGRVTLCLGCSPLSVETKRSKT